MFNMGEDRLRPGQDAALLAPSLSVERKHTHAWGELSNSQQKSILPNQDVLMFGTNGFANLHHTVTNKRKMAHGKTPGATQVVAHVTPQLRLRPGTASYGGCEDS